MTREILPLFGSGSLNQPGLRSSQDLLFLSLAVCIPSCLDTTHTHVSFFLFFFCASGCIKQLRLLYSFPPWQRASVWGEKLVQDMINYIYYPSSQKYFYVESLDPKRSTAGKVWGVTSLGVFLLEDWVGFSFDGVYLE